jgi:two-component system, OmpR family, phosphate regulon sensor histidine kinase PhoR
VKHRSPTTVFLHRARLVFVLTALVPTVMMAALGIVIVATGGSSSVALVGGILLLAFCATALAGYTLGTIFVTRGASLAAVQNDFLSSVSHELRTPLTSIRMFIDTLREERVTDAAEKQRCLSIIDRELGRLDALVGRLIELSKLESRSAVFDRRPVAVGDVVDDALASLKTIDLARGADIKVSVHVDRSLLVHGDREALGRALGNLLSNAWKYTRPEGKEIEVATRADAKHVFLSVTDNGVGIAPAEQEAIFEKFHRSTAAVEGGGPGSGLGLAIVRAIIKAHRGRIDVRSEVDRGTSFRITLPRRFREAA